MMSVSRWTDMIGRIVLLCVIWTVGLPSHSTLETKTGLRWEVLESDGRRVRSLSDGQQIVTLEYNNNSQLIQCWDTKQGRTDDAISLLFYSAMSDKVADKQAIMIHMPTIISACDSYMKNVFNTTADNNAVKTGEDKNKLLQSQVEAVDMLREGFDGSKWCGLLPKKSKAKALKKEDRCCKKWHHCEISVPGYSYDYMMYNYLPYQLMACNCTVELEQCLRDQTTSVLAEEVVETMFDQSDLRCLAVERKEENCVEWDNFFHSCTKKTMASYAKIITLSEYRTGSAADISADSTEGVTSSSTSVADDIEREKKRKDTKNSDNIYINHRHVVDVERHEL